MNRLTTSQGGFDLARFPEHPRDPFRAWDAADEYLLRQLEGIDGAEPVDLSGAVVVVGDRWGALTTVLARHRPVQITDSYLAQRATLANLARNGDDPDTVRLLSARDTPPERIDVLLVRVPKSLALLEDQLHRLAPAVHAGTVVIGTGMVKEIHTSTLKLFERIIGPTRTSLAVKKARLIFCTPTLRWPAPPARGRTATTCPKVSAPSPAGPLSTTPGSSAPSASTSAPGSS